MDMGELTVKMLGWYSRFSAFTNSSSLCRKASICSRVVPNLTTIGTASARPLSSESQLAPSWVIVYVFFEKAYPERR